MEDKQIRQRPLNQRGNIDGIRARRPDASNQPTQNSNEPSSGQKPNQQVKKAAVGKSRKSRNLPAIFIAIIILVGLSGLAIYNQRQKNSGENTTGQASESAVVQNDTTQDEGALIDATINEIDQLNDQPDSSGEGLSNDKLGL